MIPTVSIIAAFSRNGVIGRGGGLPWRLVADLARFRALTMGRPVVMGRRTFESIGRPLMGRRTIVLTHQPGWRAPGVEVASTLEQALVTAAEPLEGIDPSEVFIAGGAAVYAQALARADRLYLTEVDAQVEGDTVFPAFDRTAFVLVSEHRVEADRDNDHPFTCRDLHRREAT